MKGGITFGIASGWDEGVDWTDTQRKNYVTHAHGLLAERGEQDAPPQLYFMLARWIYEARVEGRAEARASMARHFEDLERELRSAREGIDD